MTSDTPRSRARANLAAVSREGPYRIRAVSELTGVPEATLRVWERRYAFPSPERSASGYRLYSARDVELVQRMRDLTAEGMAPVDAARVAAEGARPRSRGKNADPFAKTALRILDATRDMDSDALRAAVQVAMTLADAQSVVQRIFRPALEAIGQGWERGELSVGHEHFASDILESATRDMLRLVGPAEPIGDALLACFADEDHVMPLYAAAFSFVSAGYRPQVLGARTPPAAVAAVIGKTAPAIVGLSVTISPPDARARALIEGYAEAIGRRPWVVGGAAAAGMRTHVERHGGQVLDPGARLPVISRRKPR